MGGTSDQAPAPGRPAERVRDPRRVRWTLVALLVVTFVLRAWYSTAKLDNTRHFDERFSLRNVATVLVEGDTRPANAFYGSLSYLPQTAVLAASEALHRATGIDALSVYDRRTHDGWSPTAYLLIRLVTSLWGTLGVWLAFVLGRRLFSARAALVGAALLSCVPAHVELSARFKPDILVVLLVTLGFLWAREAVLRPSPRRWLLAGLGVGLGVATKYTAVGVAIPLAAGALAAGWRGRRPPWRRLAWLAAAGAVSVAVFFLLNPHFDVIVRFLPRLWRIMESKGEATGGGHWTVVVREAEFLLGHHGPVVLAFAAAGLAGLAVRLVRRRGAAASGAAGGSPGGPPGGLDPRRIDALMVLSYVVGYSALYAAATKLFRGQNYLPVTVFTSLAAGWAIVGLWDRLTARRPALGRLRVAAPLWGALALVLLAPRAVQVYEGLVPTTWERARDVLAGGLRPVEMRVGWYERTGDDRLQLYSEGHRVPVHPVERLTEVPAQRLDRSDAEVFPGRRLDGPEAEAYWRRIAETGERSVPVRPRLFRARGEPLVVLLHPWRRAGPPRRLELAGVDAEKATARFTAAVAPPFGARELVSLSVRMPWLRGHGRPGWVEIGGERVTLQPTRRSRGELHLQSGRAAAAAGASALDLAFERPPTPGTEVTLYRWLPPGAADEPDARSAQSR